MTTARYFFAAGLGLVVAAGLLWLMQLLIDIGPGAVVEPRIRHELAWVREPPPPPAAEDEPRDRPPPPAIPPERRPPGNDNEGFLVDPPAVDPEAPQPAWQPADFGVSDGPLVAMMNVRPVYPAQAAGRGLEGYVVVGFDVTGLGTVANAVVIESSHAVFERAAIEAAERSRFRPRIVDGAAVATSGLRKLYRFELEE